MDKGEEVKGVFNQKKRERGATPLSLLREENLFFPDPFGPV